MGQFAICHAACDSPGFRHGRPLPVGGFFFVQRSPQQRAQSSLPSSLAQAINVP